MIRCDVLFLIRSMHRGGAERQLSLLARELHARGLKVTVAVFYSGGPWESELIENGVPVLDLGKRGRWANFGVIIRLLKFIIVNKPKVLHSYMPSQNVLAILLRPWVKMNGGAVVCGLRSSEMNLTNYDLFVRLVSKLQLVLLKYADLVISNSRAALYELDLRIRAGHGVVVPNGVEFNLFGYDRDAGIRQRKFWSISPNAKVIGLVGRLDPQKNHRLIIDAFCKICDIYPEFYVVFVGDGPSSYKKSISLYAESLGLSDKVIWVGPSSRMSDVYSALDVLCLCSSAEGFPNVVGEAMSAGLPCIVTDVGDSALVVGDCGWVVPDGNADALAAALTVALSRLDAWDPERPRQRIIECFAVDQLANRTLEALKRFLK